MKYWLMKTEPDTYSIDRLAKEKTTPWEGVRNYQARNYMRDQMNLGDMILFYHSSTSVPGIVGLAKVIKKAYPDPSAWDPKSNYYDPKSSPNTARWMMVDVGFVEKFQHPITLAQMKADPALEGLLVIKRGMRLSIQPVSAPHFNHLVELATSPR